MSDAESKREPIVVTPELVALVLTRAKAVIDYLTDDELRLREYVHTLFMASIRFAEQNSIPVQVTGEQFADAAMADLAFAREAIAAILRDGTVAPKRHETGQYM